MQLYQYKCSRCGKSFIAASPEDGKNLTCLQCGSLKTYRVATQFGGIETLEEEAKEPPAGNESPKQ